MSRIFLLPLLAAPLLAAGAAQAATAVMRGNLVFDGIPEPASEASDKIDRLDAYLSARQARPQGFTAKGQVLIATRFGEVDQLHVVDQALGDTPPGHVCARAGDGTARSRRIPTATPSST